jgi:hypothetical protein
MRKHEEAFVTNILNVCKIYGSTEAILDFTAHPIRDYVYGNIDAEITEELQKMKADI